MSINLFNLAIVNVWKLKRKFVSFVVIIIITLLIGNLTFSAFDSINANFSREIIDNSDLNIIDVTALANSSASKDLDYTTISKFTQIPNVLYAYPEVKPTFMYNEAVSGTAGDLFFFDTVPVPETSVHTLLGKDFSVSSIKKGEIIVSTRLMERLRTLGKTKNIGDTISLNLQELLEIKDGSPIGTVNDIPFKIIAIYNDDNVTEKENYKAYINLEDSIYYYLRSTGKLVEGKTIKDIAIPLAKVIIDDVQNVTSVAREIRALAFDVYNPLLKVPGIAPLAVIVGGVGGILVIVLLIFAIINVFTLISSLLRERNIEFGILKCFGYTTADIFKITLLEILLVVIFVSILGSTLLFISTVLVNSWLESSSLQIPFRLYVSPLQLVITIMSLFMVTILTTILVIIRNAKLSPIKLIRL
jgi:ABC-type antimicrobial peptide transport system permease subunit